MPLSLQHESIARYENLPIRVIGASIRAQKLLLPSLIREMPPHQITIFLCGQHRDKMNARPHLLSCELTAFISLCFRFALIFGAAIGYRDCTSVPEFLSQASRSQMPLFPPYPTTISREENRGLEGFSVISIIVRVGFFRSSVSSSLPSLLLFPGCA